MQEAFNTIVDLAMQEPGRSHMRPVIEKELLHYDILFALSEAKLLDALTFQGGHHCGFATGRPAFRRIWVSQVVLTLMSGASRTSSNVWKITWARVMDY